jgi:MYXO-CTERM domain-containing protein
MVGLPIPLLILATDALAPRPVGTMGSGLDAYETRDEPLHAETCPAGATLPGIDVSKWQGDIDWHAVKADGIVYGIMRASHGINTIDEWFDSNWAESHEAGVYAGVYQYFEPGQDPIVQADILLEMMGPLGPEDLPPVIDVESHGDLPPAEVAAAVGEWIAHVEAATGTKPIIYTGRYFWQDYVQSPAFADYPLWIAHYTDGCPNIPSPWTDWAFHQYTDSGSVAGVDGGVDRNDFNGDLAQLSTFFAAPAECGDAVCSGGEDADACPGDCPPCGTIAPGGGDIDDGDACYTLGGPQEYWRRVSEGEQGDSAWTAVTDAAERSNYAEVELFFAEAGRYRVEAHLVGAYAQSELARYQITHGEGTSDVVVDQGAASGWIELGTLQFVAGGHDQLISIGDNTGESSDAEIRLGLDAFRFTRVDPPPTPGDGDEASGSDEGGDDSGDGDGDEGTDDAGLGDDDDGGGSGDDGAGLPPGFAEGESVDGCGCTSTGSRSGGALLLVAVALLRRRRRVD